MARVAVELVRPEPDWASALARALERPQGVPERRAEPRQDPPPGAVRRRRISDELIWLRDVIDDPKAHSFECDTGAAHLWWPVGDADSADTADRLERLRERGILDAAGFLLHDESLDDIDLE